MPDVVEPAVRRVAVAVEVVDAVPVDQPVTRVGAVLRPRRPA